MTCEKKDRCEHGEYCQKHIGIVMNNCCFFEQKEPLNNEEWFCSLSTEEKVSALLMLHEKVRQRMRTEIGGENSFYKGDYYREWLKEKHNGNMG